MHGFESEFALHLMNEGKIANRNRLRPAFVSSTTPAAQQFTYPLNESGSDDARPSGCCNALASQRSDESVGYLLKAEQERGPDFLRLANALSTLYPKEIEEKRLLDAMLLAVPR
jgi:hypothetical protein